MEDEILLILGLLQQKFALRQQPLLSIQMAQRAPAKSWINQILRRFQRWYEIDPEFRNYLPDSHLEWRHPSPAYVA